MTEAPEYLWCEHDNDPERSEVEAIGYNRALPYTAKYIRADIAEAMVAAERERCANLADMLAAEIMVEDENFGSDGIEAAFHIAAAIRKIEGEEE